MSRFPSSLAVIVFLIALIWGSAEASPKKNPLRFREDGQFKILQVADMHYSDGLSTPCEDVLPSQIKGCSDLNTTAFVRQMIDSEKPDLVVFTGDDIFGFDATDAAKSMDDAFPPRLLRMYTVGCYIRES